MKVAVSIPDPIFDEAERLAKRMKTSRSKLYARALDSFVATHAADAITDAMNAAVEAAGEAKVDRFTKAAAERVLKTAEW